MSSPALWGGRYASLKKISRRRPLATFRRPCASRAFGDQPLVKEDLPGQNQSTHGEQPEHTVRSMRRLLLEAGPGESAPALPSRSGSRITARVLRPIAHETARNQAAALSGAAGDEREAELDL